MDQAQEQELFEEYRRTGDISIRNQLVENYIHVARILAKKFAGRGVEYDDLLQVASEALTKGVEKFDPSMGNKFTTYITPTITGEIKNYFRDYSRAMRLPRRLYALTTAIRSATESYFKENGTKPTVKQLAEILKVEEEEVLQALESRSTVSLDATIQSEDGEGALYDVIPDSDDTFEKFEDFESLKSEIQKLDALEQKIVYLRYTQGKSQSEVGKILGVSQMSVSRAEQRLLKKLREAMS